MTIRLLKCAPAGLRYEFEVKELDLANNYRRTLYFNANEPIRKTLGFTDQDIDRLRHPDHAMHMVHFQVRLASIAANKGFKTLEVELLNIGLDYSERCTSQITRRV